MLASGRRLYSTAAGVVDQVRYPYFVRRTAGNALPVYTELKNGKTRRETIIRRIEGDAEKLRHDLMASFEGVAVQRNPRTNHLIIKGWHTAEIREWLASKGF
ncbi:hypothetical protein BZG36_00219 [Bifiguratus adelaidae]|uniref:Large ribosomal subunit protein mL49 n=1 Tax=Bifiguratus adelaidae TaxID=1938954 RepID=A0A261Y8F8_9FUNG|nr:hypothetical protein BZG36_00219 [Bifiguratus adelaidae]